LGAPRRAMTSRSSKTSGGKKRGRAKASGDPMDAILMAALVHVPFDGFTVTVLVRAADAAGVSRQDARRLFPDGPLSLVKTFSEWADAEMIAELARKDLPSLKVRERITLSIKTRISVLTPHKEAARRAAAFLTLPPYAALGAKLLYRTVDAIWRAAGDTSTDFNFYTKRAILAGVYSATMMRWFSDMSAGQTETDRFLRHRIDDVMKFEKFKARLREQISTLPSLAEILTPGRTRRSKAGAG